MITVEVYHCSDGADEVAAAAALRQAKGLDERGASQPFGSLYWHKRPFSIRFATAEEADRFVERLGTCGYRSRAVAEGDGKTKT